MPCAASHKPKSPQQLLQEALDAAFPTLGINPQLLMKKRGTPDPALPVVYPGEGAPKKRKQSEPEDSRPPKKSRTGAQDSAIYCPWPQCDFKGGPCQLWEHLQASHEQVGRHPAPKDLVRCNWDGCVFEGTPAEVVGHFECKHDRGHSGRGRNAPESPGPEEEGDEENQERNTSSSDMPMASTGIIRSMFSGAISAGIGREKIKIAPGDLTSTTVYAVIWRIMALRLGVHKPRTFEARSTAEAILYPDVTLWLSA